MQTIARLLEALADCHAAPLSIVLCAYESGTGMLSEMFAVLTVHHLRNWPVGLAVLPELRRCSNDDGVGFDRLRLQIGGLS
jgi:hypothetical protein